MSKKDFQNGFALGLSAKGKVCCDSITPLDNTVKFTADGENYEIISVREGNSVNAPLKTPVSENGKFKQWQIDGVAVSFPFTPAKDVEISALFQTVRTELEVYSAGENISSSMGTKTNGGMAIYGLSDEHHAFSGTWYTGYLIGRTEESVLTSKNSTANTFEYNGIIWYYSSVRTTNNKSTYTDGVVEPYFAGSYTGTTALTKILDYYFYVEE